MKKGMTILEIIIVLIIITLIFALALPNFGKMQERSLDKEPIGNLKRIQEAERIYYMESTQSGGTGNYFPSSGSISNVDQINSSLRVNLLSSAAPNWNYTVSSDGSSSATRNIGASDPYYRTWSLGLNDNNPTCSGGGQACPPPLP
ncbi:MAG: prepilin-type N-terminal cleavage/methylation domain-containing protein [Candidatus Omnitrophica bacterium]|nr:prepilin-type N-terminal cleavage/methylation domain-containing protein [Candidatus Omnitrophota bacterium]MDD5167148.1 prepilin-type N-terminal cleavage/methylation domain-containing protein [Candidatus Omnitrophota bacterium]